MTLAFAFAALLLHLALMLATAPLLLGAMRAARARLAGRAGPSPLQSWRDLRKLARKQPVIAESASWLVRVAPTASFAVTLAAAALVPSFTLDMASAPLADLLLIAGLFATRRAILALAAMDSGTSLGGLGASRTTSLAVPGEGAMFLVIFTLGLVLGTTNLPALAEAVRDGAPGLRLSLGVALLAMLALGVTESGCSATEAASGGRELDMVRQALAVEYSGRHLALVEWGAGLQRLVWFSLIGTVFAPFAAAALGGSPLAWPLGLLGWGLRVVLLAAGSVTVEPLVGHAHPVRLPALLGVALVLALLATVFLFLHEGFA